MNKPKNPLTEPATPSRDQDTLRRIRHVIMSAYEHLQQVRHESAVCDWYSVTGKDTLQHAESAWGYLVRAVNELEENLLSHQERIERNAAAAVAAIAASTPNKGDK